MKPNRQSIVPALPLAGTGAGEAAPARAVAAALPSPPDRSDGEIRRVVGLKYDPDAGGLPQVILKGAGPLAEQILARRRARVGAHVVRNEALLQSLYRLPLDAQIGPELFHVVAVILAHVLALEAQLKTERGI
jgi:flagellar biosynthesis protein